MHTTIVLALLLALIAGCQESNPGIQEIKPDALLERLDSSNPPVVLDVRTPEEYATGHVPGAINIPHMELTARLIELADARGRPIVVYCERGARAAVAESVLLNAGFKDIHHLRGDMSAWRHNDLPCSGC